MQEIQNILYTIGHSTHHADYFLELLQAYRINYLIDVRSVAASRFNPQFNEKKLTAFLREYHITYLHFKNEFGARQTNPSALDSEGRVDFERFRQTPEFRSGIERIRNGIQKGFNISLMCAEADPLNCHRFGMITPALIQENIDVRHILKDKTWIPTSELEKQLLEKYKRKLPERNLYVSQEDQLQIAHKLLNKAIGYLPSVSPSL